MEEKNSQTASALLKKLLDSRVFDEKTVTALQGAGFKKKEMTRRAALVHSLYTLACSGNSKAVDTVLTLGGERADDSDALPQEIVVALEE